MKEIKSYYNLLLSGNTGAEHWEIMLVKVSEDTYWGSAVETKKNLSFEWRLLYSNTEEEAFDEMVDLTKTNHI